MLLVSQLARRHVTVALSGDGGDELFGGYTRYSQAESLWRLVGALPAGVRGQAAVAIGAMRPERLDRALAHASPRVLAYARGRLPGDTLRKVGEVLAAKSFEALYLRLVSTWREPGTVTGSPEPAHAVFGAEWAGLGDLTAGMMRVDAATYLADDILVKVDRAAMAVSLETRVPLLDPDLARFAWSLPSRLRVRGGRGKHVLREVLARYVPRRLFERPKMGFGVPIDSWLRGSLKDWASSLLAPARLRRDGFFEPRAVEQKLKEHLSGAHNWQFHLWHVLVFQAWLDDLRSTRAPALAGQGE
jgi:asparagine synthase (glutamine-hydrolysing)